MLSANPFEKPKASAAHWAAVYVGLGLDCCFGTSDGDAVGTTIIVPCGGAAGGATVGGLGAPIGAPPAVAGLGGVEAWGAPGLLRTDEGEGSATRPPGVLEGEVRVTSPPGVLGPALKGDEP